MPPKWMAQNNHLFCSGIWNLGRAWWVQLTLHIAASAEVAWLGAAFKLKVNYGCKLALADGWEFSQGCELGEFSSFPGGPLHGLLGLPYSMVAAFQEQTSHDNRAERHAIFMTLPWLTWSTMLWNVTSAILYWLHLLGWRGDKVLEEHVG